jgi:hypothetical protein
MKGEQRAFMQEESSGYQLAIVEMKNVQRTAIIIR